jgi:Zn-finger in ubiquitin-hydrolases and other protein
MPASPDAGRSGKPYAGGVSAEIDPSVPPSGTGCVECLAADGWWFHLRRCATCGHIGCCDSSPSQHASAHARATGHRVIRSFEPGESWFWDFGTDQEVTGPPLAPPEHHPLDQPVPGPPGRVPRDWQFHLH